MTDLVPENQIEKIVGVPRHPLLHLGRAVSSEKRVYILHSEHCKKSTPDLRDCTYSVALDEGINPSDWEGLEDRAVVLGLDDAWGQLVPLRTPPPKDTT